MAAGIAGAAVRGGFGAGQNLLPQGTMQGDLNAGGHNITNVGTVSAVGVALGGSAADAPGGLVKNDSGSVVRHAMAFPVGAAGINIVCIGDSLVSGNIADSRQTWPAMLSSAGFGQNANVYAFGFSGCTFHSIDAIYATNESILKWTPGAMAGATVSTCPHGITAAGGWVVIVASGSDYCGVMLNATLSTSSATVTGLSRTFCFVDGLGFQKDIQRGDAVSGTGIPSGTTVVSKTSSTVTLSATPTANGTQLLTFTPQVGAGSVFGTALLHTISQAKSDGYKVAVCTVTPANNTPGGLVDGQTSQGFFQANRLTENAYVKSLTYDGAGSDPDLLIDLAGTDLLGTYNALLWGADSLHPNQYGNMIYAADINGALSTTLVSPAFWYPFAAEGIVRNWLPAATVFCDTPTAFTQTLAVHPNFSSNVILALAGGTDGASGQYGSDILMQKTVGSTATVWDIHSDDTSAGVFSIGDTSGNTVFWAQGATNGSLSVGTTARTGNLTFQTGGTTANYTVANDAMQQTVAGLYVNSGHYNSGASGASDNARVLVGGFSSAGAALGCNWGVDDGVVIQPLSSGKNIYVQNSANSNLMEITSTGSLGSEVAGQGFFTKEGSNAKQGTATLSGGAATVSDTNVTANSRIFLCVQTLGTVTSPKSLAVTARTVGTSFTITSADNTDTSVVAYEIFEPAP